MRMKKETAFAQPSRALRSPSSRRGEKKRRCWCDAHTPQPKFCQSSLRGCHDCNSPRDARWSVAKSLIFANWHLNPYPMWIQWIPSIQYSKILFDIFHSVWKSPDFFFNFTIQKFYTNIVNALPKIKEILRFWNPDCFFESLSIVWEMTTMEPM